MRTFVGLLLGVGLVWAGAAALGNVPESFPGYRLLPWLVVAGVLVLTCVCVESIVRRTSGRVGLFGAVSTGLGVWFAVGVPAETPGQSYWPWALVAGLVLLGGLFLRSWRSGSSRLVNRTARRSRRNDGVAGAFTVWWKASARAMRRKAKVLRPSLAKVSWWARRKVPVTEYATVVARVGLTKVWSPCEDVTLRLGGPRTGKTGELMGKILDAPGAVIATSTRTDLLTVTGPLRERRGPISVFNPSGLGEIPSTIGFNPLSGCGDPAVATYRAEDLIRGVSSPGGTNGDREFWAGQARRVLAVLLHAAAIGERTMRDVQYWIANPTDEAAASEVQGLLRKSPDESWETAAVEFFTMNDRTRTSITATIMPALGWLSNATAAAAAEKGDFYVRDLLDSRGTVYMLGAEDAQTAPLVTALTGHIAREARQIASTMDHGRLDPPLTLALDEAALICPIPLDLWTADMGGRNVTLHIAAQSRAQLRQRWGDVGAAAIINNAATIMLFGGTKDPDDLAAYSVLTGMRDEEVNNYDPDGHVAGTTIRQVPVLSAAQIAQLPERKVVIVRRGMLTALGTAPMAWKRWDVRLHKWGSWWTPRIVRWTAAARRRGARAVEAFQAAAVRLEPWFERMSRTKHGQQPPHRIEPAQHDNIVRAGSGEGRWPR